MAWNRRRVRIFTTCICYCSNTQWTINWSVSTDVMFDERPVENWVTTGLSITFGDDSMKDISRVVDAKIIDGKMKTVYIYQRQLNDSEIE